MVQAKQVEGKDNIDSILEAVMYVQCNTQFMECF